MTPALRTIALLTLLLLMLASHTGTPVQAQEGEATDVKVTDTGSAEVTVDVTADEDSEVSAETEKLNAAESMPKVTLPQDPALSGLTPDEQKRVLDKQAAEGVSGDLPPGFIPDADTKRTAVPGISQEAGPGRGDAGIKEPDNADLFGGSALSDDELRNLLPDFARGQPGTSGSLSDLLGEPEGPGKFETLLGDSILPENSVDNELDIQRADPGRDVQENFARVVVPDGTITGSTEKKQFHIEGGLIIYYNEVEIEADKADIDERNEVARLYGHVSVVDPEYTLLTEEMLINFKEKRFEAKGFVQFKKNAKANASVPDLSKDKKSRLQDYFSKQQFELFCSKLLYNWESKELLALDSVRLVHPAFNGTLNRLEYEDKAKVYAMEGQVVLEITNYDWIFANQLVESADEKKVRAITDGNTKITADRVLYSDESGIAEFFGINGNTVKFEQPKRSITASYIEVNDKTKDFYAEGNEGGPAIYQQQDGQWLIAAGLVNKDEVSKEINDSMAGPLTAKAGSLTYNFDRKRLELRQDVSITTESKSVTAGEIIQDETAKFFLMRENVVLKPDGEGYIYAAQIYVDTANDVFTFVGMVDGKFQSEDIPDLNPAASEDVAAAGSTGSTDTDRQGPAAGIFQNVGGTGPAISGTGGTPGRGTSDLVPEAEEDDAYDGERRKPRSSLTGKDEEEADPNVAEK